jgi:hypothetical protein
MNTNDFVKIQDSDLFNEVMIGIFLRGSSLEKSLELLDSGFIDIYSKDKQLIRELNRGRLELKDTLRVYKILVDKYDYVITSENIDGMLKNCCV